MTAIIVAAIASGAVVVTIVTARGRLTPFFLTTLSLVPVAVGHARLDSLMPLARNTSALYLVSLWLLVAGYVTATSRYATRPPQHHDRAIARSEVKAISVLVVAIASLTLYHFARVGIPILSANVEVARYNFTGSGLVGVPGRAFLFGVPLVAVAALRLWRGAPDDRRLRTVAVSTVVLLVLSRIAAGFRSGALEVLVVIFVGLASSGRGLSLYQGLRRYAIPVAMAFVFAVQLSQAYGTVARQGSDPGWQIIWDRATIGVAESGHLALQSGNVLVLSPETALGNDGLYFLARYAGVGEDTRYTFSQNIAAVVSAVPLDYAKSAAPVTVGGFPELYYDMGLAAFVVMLAAGVGYRKVEHLAFTTDRTPTYVLAVATIFAVNDAVTKGEPIYALLNWGFVGCLVAGAFKLLDGSRVAAAAPPPGGVRTNDQGTVVGGAW